MVRHVKHLDNMLTFKPITGIVFSFFLGQALLPMMLANTHVKKLDYSCQMGNTLDSMDGCYNMMSSLAFGWLKLAIELMFDC